MSRLQVTGKQQGVVDEYVAARGRSEVARRQASRAGRWFLSRFGAPAGWRQLTVAEQQQLPENVKAFVCWLMVCGYLRATAEYVVLGQPKLGLVGAWVYPDIRERLARAEDLLGHSPETRRLAWSALMRTVALTGVAPQKVRRRQLDQAHSAIEEARHRLVPRPPQRRKDNNGVNISMPDGFRPLELLLFHAGISDEPPRRQPGKNLRPLIDSEWAAIPEPMRSTMLDYLDQVRLTSRPSTVKRDSRTLRDLGVFWPRKPRR